MGAPRPWPTRWPEPTIDRPLDDPDYELPDDPDYTIEEDPLEDPYNLPEERLRFRLATWGVTGRCHLRCTHCYATAHRPARELDSGEARAVLDRLAAVGVACVVFSGGEPTLRADLPDLLGACRARGIEPVMRSGGTEITPEKAERLAACGLGMAGISLEGATAATHEAVRGPGTFQPALAGAVALRAAGVPVTLEVTLSRHNAGEALDCLTLAASLGLDGVTFAALAPVGRAADRPGDGLTPAQWTTACRELGAASRTAPVTVWAGCALAGACMACIEPHITPDGWVTPCYLSGTRLFDARAVPPDEWADRLRAARPAHQNGCGRLRWAGTKRRERVPAGQMSI